MDSKDILDLVLRQLARDDPIRFGAARDADPAVPVPALVKLLREVIAEAVGTVGKSASQEETLQSVWMRLSREKEMLDHAAFALRRAIIFQSVAPERSPLVSTPAQEDVDDLMKKYVKALKALSKLIGPVQDAYHLPVTTTVHAELKFLPPVFEFLATRRSRLRRLIHSISGSAAQTCRDSDADPVFAVR